MEASLELEDDVYFADLSRQISLLIMDDDDHHHHEDSLSQFPSVNFQVFTQEIHPVRQASFVNYEQYQTSHKRESKGTGVFIPHPSHPRRKHNIKQSRSFTAYNNGNNNNNKFQRPSDHYNYNSRGLPSHDHSYHESLNLRKY